MLRWIQDAWSQISRSLREAHALTAHSAWRHATSPSCHVMSCHVMHSLLHSAAALSTLLSAAHVLCFGGTRWCNSAQRMPLLPSCSVLLPGQAARFSPLHPLLSTPPPPPPPPPPQPPPRHFGSIFSTLLPGTTAKLEPPEGADFLQGEGEGGGERERG